MERLNKIFADWAKQDKTELKSEKVELGLADDLKKLNSSISKIENDLRQKAKKGFELVEAQKELNQNKQQISKDLLSDIQKGNKSYKELDTLLQKTFKTAKDLGLDANDIPNYRQSTDQLSQIINATDLAEDALNELK